jgi:hypothetical protein
VIRQGRSSTHHRPAETGYRWGAYTVGKIEEFGIPDAERRFSMDFGPHLGTPVLLLTTRRNQQYRSIERKRPYSAPTSSADRDILISTL